MWFPSLLLLVAFTGVIADLENDVKKCVKALDVEEMVRKAEMPDTDELAAVCPGILGFMQCLDDAVKRATGFNIQELGMLMQGTEEAKYFYMFTNVHEVLKDLCDENSELNAEYKEHSECYKRVSTSEDDDLCETEALVAFQTSQAFENQVQEEAGDSSSNDNRECMLAAYKVACAAVQVHEECGQDAFATFMKIIKRTTLFKYGICSEEQLEDVKDSVLDNLEMDSAQKEIYRLAFDLKKRRK